MDDPTTNRQKMCVRCEASKPVSEFNRQASAKDGLKSWCRSCSSQYRREWYLANQDRERVKSREWAKTNPDKIRASQKRRFDENPSVREMNRVRAAQWRAANPGAWSDYYKKNKERLEQRARQYAKENPNKIRQQCARIRARKAGVIVERVDYDAVFSRCGLTCGVCGGDIPPDDYEFDHIIPLSKGGPHREDNVQIVHSRCNRSKKDKILEDMRGGDIVASRTPAPKNQP